ncbi:type I restriction endonuclease subunit R [Ureaplasma canigenitalium]|uniref:type I restriction endonuclease subunit R n=1 Tax=Ureaplasma canigenitalium TaxID=42092 RepID=UPI0004E1E9EE|nr:type I restriction endonuclease subunit R [Ureaplasma canigenitalium]
MKEKTPLAWNDYSTVVAEFKSDSTFRNNRHFETERELEQALIDQLISQGYEYLSINHIDDLKINLRKQIERLNNYRFSEAEYETFLSSYLLNKNQNLADYSFKIQKDYVYNLTLDNGTTKNIKILDKQNIHNNYLQIINQYRSVNDDSKTSHRYDVTILVNGIPLVHIELKRRGVHLKEAFNQITRYRESFDHLFSYVQIFVISNGTYTKYYSNTTRKNSLVGGVSSSNNAPNNFKFTMYWSDTKNNLIFDLIDFASTFLARHTILNVLIKYCVLTTENKLLVLRPYQIVATEKIINKITTSLNTGLQGTRDAGGYIWHTTGSGKTLTSFKTSTLAQENPDVDKVLFVVDRKDLDHQTMQEYNRYCEDSVLGSRNQEQLKKNLESNDASKKVIVTTIQKLNNFIENNPNHPVYNKNVVLIFDECHRSQFGEFHKKITKKAFNKYLLFGFTGTPIFDENSNASLTQHLYRTTKDVFGACLHTYTIDKAVRDENVLPFRIEYVNTIKVKEDIKDKEVANIITLEILENEQRIKSNVQFILKDYDRLTKAGCPSKTTNIDNGEKVRSDLNGFNSILACSSIKAAKLYYDEFRKQMKDNPSGKQLKIGLIYSYSPNEGVDDCDILDDENNEDTSNLNSSDRAFLQGAINDYNSMFNTSYSTNGENFNGYYKDFSLRLKKRQLDLAIVVNMFLTGFDSPTLNTLWLDKRLNYHGLLQAMSRTNRILNEVKSNGNVVCFATSEEIVNNTIQMFTNPDNLDTAIIVLRNFNDYYNGYHDEFGHYVKGYKELVDELRLRFNDHIYYHWNGEKDEKAFVQLFSEILRYRNLLSQFIEFENDQYLPDSRLQDYKSTYLELHQKYRGAKHPGRESVIDDVVFELELIKSVDINIDYIINIMKGQVEKQENIDITLFIPMYINSSPSLRSKKDLIERFLHQVNTMKEEDASLLYEYWNKFILEEKTSELSMIVKELDLREEETKKFVEKQFMSGTFNEYGTDITKVIKPVSRIAKDGEERSPWVTKKEKTIDKLKDYFEKYYS